jgi:hypothetical protein
MSANSLFFSFCGQYHINSKEEGKEQKERNNIPSLSAKAMIKVDTASAMALSTSSMVGYS